MVYQENNNNNKQKKQKQKKTRVWRKAKFLGV